MTKSLSKQILSLNKPIKMAGERRYSEILTEILQRKHSKCTCPPEYFHTTAKIKNPNLNMDGCQFGPDCQFLGGNDPVECQYNEAQCTCFPQCICGPQPQMPVQLLQGPELDQVIDAQMCICGANCYCESEDAILSSNICRPSPNCNKVKCICDVCLCQPVETDSRLLPTDFRNAVKREPLLSTDDKIKQECAEIKQLLIEHEESKKKEHDDSKKKEHDESKKKEHDESKKKEHDESKKKELEEPTVSTADKSSKKQIMQKEVSILDEHASSPPQTDNKDDNKDVADPQEKRKSPGDLAWKLRPKEYQETIKKNNKTPKKEKTPKKKARQINVATPDTVFTQYSCGCSMPKQKVPHIRYYFSGGTEHYGVKLGHKKCQPKATSVPKNMGWLWNIEDPSRGIRERKGWPPGFIAKNIKNMIKVLKQFDNPAGSGVKMSPVFGHEKRIVNRWREEGKLGSEPQEEPPLLHIHKKGRTYNITFCPKSSDTDIGPIPIPFSITEKRRDSDSDTSDSTLEFEFHSPKPRLKINRPLQLEEKTPTVNKDQTPDAQTEQTETTVAPPSTKPAKKKHNNNNKRSSKSMQDENKNLWEEQQTQIQKMA